MNGKTPTATEQEGHKEAGGQPKGMCPCGRGRQAGRDKTQSKGPKHGQVQGLKRHAQECRRGRGLSSDRALLRLPRKVHWIKGEISH